MGGILGNWRVPAAAFLSAALIVSAYALAKSMELPPLAVASEETALLHAIATRDSDSDKLPDWEEALYGTDPSIADSRKLGMTDGEAVAKGLIVPKAIADIKVATSTPLSTDFSEYGLPPPPADDTLTAAFAKSFFTYYLEAKEAKGDAQLSESELSRVEQQALASLTDTILTAPDFKRAGDLRVAKSGPEAMREFAVSAENVFFTGKINAEKSELAYLSDALEKGDKSGYDRIAAIAKGYREVAIGLSVLPVPPELLEVDLAIINSIARISEIDMDFTRTETDPLAAILALGQFPGTVQKLAAALTRLSQVYAAAGVVFEAGEPGAEFVSIMGNLPAESAKK